MGDELAMDGWTAPKGDSCQLPWKVATVNLKPRRIKKEWDNGHHIKMEAGHATGSIYVDLRVTTVGTPLQYHWYNNWGGIN